MKRHILLLLALVLLTAGCTQQGTNSGPSPSQETGQPYISTQQPPRDWDYGPVGSLNHELLQTQPFPNVIIEMDYAEGYAPTTQTKSALKQFFEDVAGKPAYFAGENVIQDRKGVYTVDDLYSVEKENRNSFTGDGNVVVYFMFLDGSFENGNALGVAYGASSAAIFSDKLNGQTTALVLYSQIEKAVAMHELGHLLGLVNINYRSEIDHEDAGHKGHSTNENSVMYWAVEDVSLKNILNLGPPDSFDSDDLADIGKIKSGSY